MTAPADALSGEIAVAGLRVELERRRAAAIRYLGERSVTDEPSTLQGLVNIAARQRERIGRIATRWAGIDARGAKVEERSERAADGHEVALDAVEGHFSAIDRFNSEMRAQLGNDLPTSRAPAGAPSGSAGASDDGK